MATEPWNPFQNMPSLRDALGWLTQESVVHPGNLWGFLGQASLPLDVAERENDFVVYASLPGVKPEDVQITIQGDMLTIRGEGQAEEERKDQQWMRRERRSGPLQRSARLPEPVNADQAQAIYDNGILTLTLPKSEAARVRHIKISAQAGPQPGQPQEPASTQAWHDRVSESSLESFPASDAPSWLPDVRIHNSCISGSRVLAFAALLEPFSFSAYLR